jgi:DNA-binding CsgD family transcriptional regulator
LNVFDQLSVGIVLLDRFARVVFANAAAQSLSADGAPVRLNTGVTTASSPHARRLDELIRSALDGTSVRTMSLPSSGSGRPLMVLVSPVGGVDMDRSDTSGIRDAAAMVMLCDPDRPAQIPAAWIMDAYGLTLAEVRVALAVSSGTTISATARQLKISPNTVKTHLRRVFGKTGTSRQAELSRLMATISLARGSESSA